MQGLVVMCGGGEVPTALNAGCPLTVHLSYIMQSVVRQARRR
jgi:hypothetical protein